MINHLYNVLSRFSHQQQKKNILHFYACNPAFNSGRTNTASGRIQESQTPFDDISLHNNLLMII